MEIGTSLEVDPVLGADSVTVDLNFAPSIISENGYTHWPPESDDPFFTISMPKFHKLKVTTQVTMQHSKYALIGTARPLNPSSPDRKSPLIMMFARTDVATAPPVKIR